MLPKTALTIVFSTAAILKVQYFLLSPGHFLANSVFASPLGVLAVVAFEIAVAITMWTRWQVWAASGAIAVSVLGTYLLATISASPSGGCACLGAVHLSRPVHAALAVAVFLLAARVILQARPHSTPCG